MGKTVETFVHPTALVDKGARLGAGVHVGPFCVVGGEAVIGDGTRLENGVTIAGRSTIGRDNLIYPYAVIGMPPQDLRGAAADTRLVIGDSNVIREHVTVNLGTERGGGVTTVGDSNYLMCACHIAHDCAVGDRCVIANEVMLAGHIRIGDSTVISGGVAIHHFVTVGEYAFIGGLSRIVSDVPPFLITEGDPGRPRAVNVVGLRRSGFDDARIAALTEAFKALFRSDLPMSKSLDRLEALSPSREVRRLAEFLRGRLRGKHGRALQP